LKRYVKHITVGAADLDALQHVNNVRYLDWVQEISREHWSELTRPDWEARYFWVVRSHHIEYLRAAVAGDHLTLTTYVPKVSGPLSHRVVEICQAGSGELVARCETQWCLLDQATKRPLRIPGPIRECF